MTNRITLVRHGRASAAWDTEHDPGLDATGQLEAEAVAATLGVEPTGPIVTSPLRRTRETAAPLAAVWGVTPVVDARVAEIPSPTVDLQARAQWLNEVMRGRWPTALVPWRDRVVEAVRGYDDGTVVFTHFIAINAVVGAATGDERVVCFAPGNGSLTVVDVDDDRLRIVALGDTAPGTRIL